MSTISVRQQSPDIRSGETATAIETLRSGAVINPAGNAGEDHAILHLPEQGSDDCLAQALAMEIGMVDLSTSMSS
ncbi:MAG: hypothetical protein SVR81_02060 [Chloroflexota bacterium]|nr:hypothetical protein [Chloroflexota bacterium]